MSSDRDRTQNKENDSLRSSRSLIDEPPRVYEEMLQGLEADVRKHIRIEQQLKLHIESVESKLEELERENSKFIQETKSLKKLLKRAEDISKAKENEIDELKSLRETNAQELQKVKLQIEEEKEKQRKAFLEREVSSKTDLSTTEPYYYFHSAIETTGSKDKRQRKERKEGDSIYKQENGVPKSGGPRSSSQRERFYSISNSNNVTT